MCSIVAAVDAMQECADSIREAQQEKEVLQNGNKMCRSGESLACARSRKGEDELEEKGGPPTSLALFIE